MEKELSNGRRDRNTWTLQQRLTLQMLGELYENTWKEKTQVFNHVHSSDLSLCEGLRAEVVNTQYNDMIRRNFDAAQATLQPYDKLNLITTSRLEQKAYEVGVRLVAKRPTLNKRILSGEHEMHVRKRQRVESFDDARTDFLPSRSRIATQEVPHLQETHSLPLHPRTPKKTKVNEYSHALLTPPDSGRRHPPRITTDKRLARIGFRACTTQSQGTYDTVLGLRAGAFLNCPFIPSAKDLDTAKYREEALHHVRKYDHSRASMFLSATKNPIRALHMLLHAPQSENSLVLIDLNLADENANVEKARDLKMQTPFGYSSASEYLIFGGVDQKAIISHIPLTNLLSMMPTTLSDEDDPFKIRVLQAHQKLSNARYAIRKELHPMTYSLGVAVGKLVGNLRIPPKHFESGVWAFVQDYKFYNTEGAKKRGQWTNNSAFKDGALHGYHLVYPNQLTGLTAKDDLELSRNVIVIEDDSEPHQTSDEDDYRPIDIADWVQTSPINQSSLECYDPRNGKWMLEEEMLSDDFLADLAKTAGSPNGKGPAIGGPVLATNAVAQLGDIAGNAGANVLEMDTDPVIDDSIAVTGKNCVHELCMDVMRTHGDEAVSSKQTEHEVETDYNFGWTGM